MKLIKVGEIIYLLLFGLIVGKGLLNYREQSKYWPGDHGVVSAFDLLRVLLVIFLFSFIVTVLISGVQLRGLSTERKKKFIIGDNRIYIVAGKK